jgi:hypothetical protein
MTASADIAATSQVRFVLLAFNSQWRTDVPGVPATRTRGIVTDADAAFAARTDRASRRTMDCPGRATQGKTGERGSPRTMRA